MSIFQDEWRDCLRAHYQYVIREDDKITLKTLVPVLHSVGFTESELAQLRFTATLRAEDMPDDFVPDMAILEAVEPPAEPVPEPPIIPVAVVPDAHGEEADDLSDDLTLEPNGEDEPPPAPDANSPQQLSFF